MSDHRVGKKISDIFLSQEPVLNPKRTGKHSENTFEGILKSVGFIVGEINNANELNVDQAVFLRDLTKVFAEKSASDVQHFIEGFETYLEDEIRLKWSLMPTLTASTCETARNVSQDSLVHLLLNIEVIQEKMIAIMLAKLAEFSYCENTALYDRSEGRTVACLIISQFRWLSKLVNGGELSDKLLELIEATPLDVQRDIIKLIPDVINEFDHPKVAKNLGNMFMGNQELNIVILDTLTNLNIDQDILADIREKVIETVSTANIEDLPVLVKFVLQDLSSSEANQIIGDLREKLDFNSTFSPIISSTPIVSRSKEISKGLESCVLNTIKHAMKFQKLLCDSWTKHLEMLQGPKNHKSLDIFVILIFFSLGINEKKVESILKNKIRTGCINDDLLQVTFRCHHDILQEYALELLKVAEAFLRSIEPSISSFGCAVYIKCFIWFDTFYKQEVIGNLITHVGNRSEAEINTALDTLLFLVSNHTDKMISFSLFVKNLLDHLNDLTLNQIRKVHEMLSILAYQGGREGSMLLDDMLIVIRKQLTNKNSRYRKMGVIGALMAAKTAAKKESVDESLSSEALDLNECCQHSIKLLELAADSTSESCDAFALFCDELSHIMGDSKLGQAILDWVGDNILSDFEEIYIVDANPEEFTGKTVNPKFGLDEVNDPVAVNLYAVIRKEFEGTNGNVPKHTKTLFSSQVKDKANLDKSRILKTLVKISNLPETSQGGADALKSASTLKLAPMFRLLRIFRQVQDQNLDAIDALLGCAIILPELKYPRFAVLSTKLKHLTLNTLFIFINWIRENINAFASTDDVDIRCNVLSRLQLLIHLEDLVCNYLMDAGGLGYTPPIANFDCDEKALGSLKLPSKSKKATKRSAKGKNAKSKKSKTDDSADQTSIVSQNCSSKSKSSDSDSDEEFEPKGSSDSRVLKCLQPFFRELDLDVFVLLKSEITFQKRGDIFSNEKISSPQLHTDELKFLLDDLSAKLHHCLNTSPFHLRGRPSKLTGSSSIGFFNIESYTPLKVVNFCIDIIPSLNSILDEFVKYFKNITRDSDGVEDSLALFATETQSIMKCMNLVLKVMKQIISWKNFNLKENASILKKALSGFNSDDSSDSATLQEIVQSCVKCLAQYADSLPSLSCAANLTQLLVCILSYADDAESKRKISTTALQFLKKKWYDLDSKVSKTAETNGYIKVILEAYLQNGVSILKALDFLSAEAIPQILDKENEVVFHTLNKVSLNTYYKIMLSNLANYVKVYFAKKHSDKDQMYEWSVAFKVFQVFTNLLKCFGSRSNIGACLKSSREILQTYLKYGMPLMDRLFVDNKEDVICLMKILQVSTRYLQHVCCHSKVLKDVSLIKHVPFLKKSLEVFVFRVKMMLAVNKCEDAFWLGNLKNRDLKGEEILSQSMQEDGGDSDEEVVKSDTDLSTVESDAE